MKVKTFFSNNNKHYFVTTDDGIPITDVCKFLKSLHLNKFSDSTISSKAYDLSLYFEYLDMFNIDYLKVNKSNLIDFISYINSDKLRSFKRIKNITTTINDFYNFISQYKENNPYIENIKKSNININKISIHKKREISALCNIEPVCELTSNLRDELLVRILFETGARGSEVINLTIDNLVYFDKNTSYCLKGFYINCSPELRCSECVHSYYGYSIKLPFSKHNKDQYRIVPISKKLASLIIEYNKKILMDIDSENKFIFIHLSGINIGKQLSYSYISTCLKSLSKKSSFTFNITPHNLRRSFILNALNKYDLQSVAYISGLTSTLSSYNYLSQFIDNKPYINSSNIDTYIFKDKNK